MKIIDPLTQAENEALARLNSHLAAATWEELTRFLISKIPPGFEETTGKQFFPAVGGQDVHPDPAGKFPYLTIWRDRRTGRPVGYSFQVGLFPPRYFLA